mmetsp:Transcript_5898/g.15128  ORF Transcript_5898/g.15128 Transcript_5898/m.15128 type:complete len:225 (+) Transcript_5898:726-1400(+)
MAKRGPRRRCPRLPTPAWSTCGAAACSPTCWSPARTPSASGATSCAARLSLRRPGGPRRRTQPSTLSPTSSSRTPQRGPRQPSPWPTRGWRTPTVPPTARTCCGASGAPATSSPSARWSARLCGAPSRACPRQHFPAQAQPRGSSFDPPLPHAPGTRVTRREGPSARFAARGTRLRPARTHSTLLVQARSTQGPQNRRSQGRSGGISGDSGRRCRAAPPSADRL